MRRRGIGALSVLVWLVLWELLVRTRVLQANYLPAPSTIAGKLIELLQTGVIVHETMVSAQRIGVGFGLATVVGIGAAVLCYVSRNVEFAVSPIVELIRGVAPLSLIPAFMLLFGLGFESKVAMIVWVTWVPIFLNTLQGTKNVDPVLIKAARSMSSTQLQIVTKVVLPGAAPFILSGLRLGMGAAFLVLVAAEMLGANDGLGFYILDSSQTFKIPEMYAAIVVIGALGLVLNWGFLAVARRLAPWSPAAD